MKYITIIYGNQGLWRSFSPEDAARAISEVNVFNVRYQKTGELLAAPSDRCELRHGRAGVHVLGNGCCRHRFQNFVPGGAAKPPWWLMYWSRPS
jgi:hypothetical protein